MINLTVFCSSKNNLNNIFYNQVEELINLLDVKKFNIVYGGGTTGLMGTVRKTFLKNNGKVISSNLVRFKEPDIVDDYLFYNMDDRQTQLVNLGSAFLILPGGYGTHYEMLEVITKNDIGETSKPIFIFNCNNVFDYQILHINNLIKEGFITRDFDLLKIKVSSDVNELSEFINNYDYKFK